MTIQNGDRVIVVNPGSTYTGNTGWDDRCPVAHNWTLDQMPHLPTRDTIGTVLFTDGSKAMVRTDTGDYIIGVSGLALADSTYDQAAQTGPVQSLPRALQIGDIVKIVRPGSGFSGNHEWATRCPMWVNHIPSLLAPQDGIGEIIHLMPFHEGDLDAVPIAMVRTKTSDFIMSLSGLQLVKEVGKPKPQTTQELLIEAFALVKDMNKRLLALEDLAKKVGWTT